MLKMFLLFLVLFEMKILDFLRSYIRGVSSYFRVVSAYFRVVSAYFCLELVSRTSKQVSRNLGPLWQPGVYNDTNKRSLVILSWRLSLYWAYFSPFRKRSPAKGVRQKESGKKVTKKVTNASEKVTKR